MTTLNELKIMALSEAGYPPDEYGERFGIPVAIWHVPPPLTVQLKARELCGVPWGLDVEEYERRRRVGHGIVTHLPDLTDDEYNAWCENFGVRGLRVSS